MFEVINSVGFFIIAIGALITFHEFGHFWVARRLGVTVTKFSIGLGPSIWRFTPRNSATEYVIAWIPLGGYVKMLDESIDEVPEEQLKHAYNRQPLWKRSSIVAAGPIANFLLAALLYAVVFVIGSDGIRPVVGEVVPDSLAERAGLMAGDEILEVDGRSVQSWHQHNFYLLNQVVSRNPIEFLISRSGQQRIVSIDFAELAAADLSSQSFESLIGMYPEYPLIEPIVGDVIENYPAALGGLKPDDRVVAVDGRDVRDWNELVEVIRETDSEQLTFTVERAEQIVLITIVPRTVVIDGREVKQIGITVNPESQIRNSDAQVTVRYNPAMALLKGIESMWSTSVLTVKMVVDLVKLDQSADAIGGPIAIAQYAGKAADSGINSYLTFLALLSISLGILNLLPIPVLDGGHLVFHAYEAVTGSPPTERMLGWANQAGLVLIISLMGFAFYNDIARIF